MKNYFEFCNQQAVKLFQIIEQHDGLLKWKKTWSVTGCKNLPRSINGFYRGGNLWKLLVEQIMSGCESDKWLTYNQVKQQGGHVLKGAKGTSVCFFKIKETEAESAEEIFEQKKLTALFRAYIVFNLDQTSLVGEGSNGTESPKLLQELLSILNVDVSEFGNQPRYQLVQDVIVMPRRENFVSCDDFNITLLHELVHWTGHPSRLGRVCAAKYMESDSDRAEEELVAEVGSVFLASYFGLSGELINHASYVASWKKFLDQKRVMRAISQASKAFEFLVKVLESREAA